MKNILLIALIFGIYGTVFPQDLEAIFDYTIDRWGIEQAYRYKNKLTLHFSNIGNGKANSRAFSENFPELHVSYLALRTDLSGNPSFSELLQRVKTTTLDAYEHQELPFEKLLEVLQPARSTESTKSSSDTSSSWSISRVAKMWLSSWVKPRLRNSPWIAPLSS